MAITSITKTAIVDELALGGTSWAGRMDEDDFMSRLYPMSDLPSHDHRFDNAAQDVHQHRVFNRTDWDDDWVFYDSRFDLMHSGDEPFLRFLAETVHPRVRPDADQAADLVRSYNRHLRHDGYELVAVSQISGRNVYSARSLLAVPAALREVERSSAIADRDYLVQQITRMETSIESDPELAIGTAKELIETACKTILETRNAAIDKRWDVPRLMKETARSLELTPEGVPDDALAADTIRRILGNLASLVAGTAELRNSYGTGHGKGPGHGGLQPRHARLAAGAAATLVIFLFETFEERDDRNLAQSPQA